MVKINMGSGEGKLKGWINVDRREEVKPDVLWDLEKFPYPFPDNYADEVMWKDVLEHLSWRVVKKALEETYRILKSGGKVFIQCPDLEAIAKKVILNPDYRFGELHGYMAIGFWVYGRQDPQPDGSFGGWGGFHKAGFTIPTLRALLLDIGFKVEKIENDGSTNIICWAVKP